MVRTVQQILKNREAQSSDTQLFRYDMPKSGAISALDIGIRLTNGATSSRGLDILDVLKHIGLVVNGNDYRWWLSGQEFYRLQWLKNGRPMPATFTEIGSGVNEVWFRMQFGRYLGDPVYGLNLDKYANVQVQVDYDCTVWGAAAVTTFTTGTFTITIIAHSFPASQRPMFRGMLGAREFYTTTTVASGDIDQPLPTANPLLALSVFAMEDNVAEATDITDIVVGKNNYETRWVDQKWYNLQAQHELELDVREEYWELYASNAATLDIHLANLDFVTIVPNAATAGVA